MRALLLFLLLYSFGIHAQTIMSNNGLLSVKNKTMISIKGDFVNKKNGFCLNRDSIFITNNLSNFNNNGCFDTLLGNGYVLMRGAQQNINGSFPFHFNHLSLRGTGIKRAFNHAYVHSKLNLSDRELNMDTNTIFVLNADSTAILSKLGFVSSLKNGGLNRALLNPATYFYPVGSSTGAVRYRPIYITNQQKKGMQYKVRFVNNNPTLDNLQGWNNTDSICSINPNWYHKIWSTSMDESIQLEIAADLKSDGKYNAIAAYQKEWTSIPQSYNSNNQRFIASNWKLGQSNDYVLAYVHRPNLFIGKDTWMYLNDTLQLNPLALGNYEWTGKDISCITCSDPFVSPKSNTIYIAKVTDGEGCFAYDSIQIVVLTDKGLNLYFPNVFTPNNDGINDVWNVSQLAPYQKNNMRILNRWGDVVYEQVGYLNQFNGNNRDGNPLSDGTYYYVLQVLNPYTNTEENYSGDLTILR